MGSKSCKWCGKLTYRPRGTCRECSALMSRAKRNWKVGKKWYD